jgi:hypothetical protein
MEFLQKVKYGGAVGKKTAITIVVLTVLGVAITGVISFAIRIRPESVLLVAAILVAVVALAWFAVFVFKHALGSIDTTLKNHPELALMDGAEIVKLREVEMAAKHITILPAIAEPMPDPQAPIELTAIAVPEEPEEED